MIIDCHTHAWADPSQLGAIASEFLRAAGDQEQFSASASDHALASQCVAKTLVLGLSGPGAKPSPVNDYIAQYAARDKRVIGIAGVDPTQDNAVGAAQEALNRPEFRGLVCSPLCQNFHPADSRAMQVYELAQAKGVPMFFDHATHFTSAGRMEYARPSLMDEVAREFPRLKIVIAAVGYPWPDEAVMLLGKHANVLADLASLLNRPWLAYNALVLAHQFGVMDKILFGSDFPYFTASEAIENLYRLHEMTQGTNLPMVPREALRGVIERDALTALGIARPGEVPKARVGIAENEVLQ
jgi:predicted TIM-barrel fold metal-dependent hydrolase